MSYIRINSIKIKNYRSFGEEQLFEFPNKNYKKPVAIIGYNNAGKTNLMNAILYGIGEKYVSKDTFEISDFHNRKIENIPELVLDTLSSIEDKYDGKKADLNGAHKLIVQTDGNEIAGAKIESLKNNGTLNYQAFGALKYYNVFCINFHKIKEEISTQKTSWGNLRSFLAKHIKKIVDSDVSMKAKKKDFEESMKLATNNVLKDSELCKFIEKIKDNYSKNLRDNNCEVDFGLPEYEDIFLQMMFKIGLNGDKENYVPISHFGDGYISMFVMAVIQAIAESNTEDKCLFLFEEPESFLHENHQEYFYKMVLCQLTEKGHQVIYTTHSDKMVDIFDTKGLIRIEFDEKSKQTVKKYNNTGEFNPIDYIDEKTGEIIALDSYNDFIRTIEPNLNKILFSKKVLLVEGPNDVMAYKFAIERKVKEIIKDDKYAETYLNFNNIAIIPHYGKITAILLIELCKHIGLDYFVVNDWDFEKYFDLTGFQSEKDLKNDDVYKGSVNKGIVTTNWKLIISAGKKKIHFNVPKLEGVLGYERKDLANPSNLEYKNKGDSLILWNKLNEVVNFEEDFFPNSLERFLEFEENLKRVDSEKIFISDEGLLF